MQQKRTFIYVGIAVFTALIAIFWIHHSQKNTSAVSNDPLVAGIVERWGAGLPDGFSKTEVNDLPEEGEGYLFAELNYQKSVSKLLAKWESAEAGDIEAFDDAFEAYLAFPGLSEEHRLLLTERRPSLNGGWITYKLTKEDDPDVFLLLFYSNAENKMVILEHQT